MDPVLEFMGDCDTVILRERRRGLVDHGTLSGRHPKLTPEDEHDKKNDDRSQDRKELPHTRISESPDVLRRSGAWHSEG